MKKTILTVILSFWFLSGQSQVVFENPTIKIKGFFNLRDSSLFMQIENKTDSIILINGKDPSYIIMNGTLLSYIDLMPTDGIYRAQSICWGCELNLKMVMPKSTYSFLITKDLHDKNLLNIHDVEVRIKIHYITQPRNIIIYSPTLPFELKQDISMCGLNLNTCIISMKINDFENNECLYQFTVKSAYNIIYHYPFKPEEKVTIWQKITGKSKITQHRVTPPVRKNFLYQ
jgi:hypothetical protein